MAGLITTSLTSDVLSITLNRPQKRNALTRELLADLRAAIPSGATPIRPRAVILAAEGPVFCAGMDLQEMQSRADAADPAAEWHADAQAYADCLTGLLELDCPTLAVVQGPAVAGGVGLVLTCDLVLCSSNAQFTLPEPTRGIVAAMVTPLLLHRVGTSAASYLLLSGESCAAETALRWGLCHDVVAADALAKRAARLVHAILAGSPAALALTKQQLGAGRAGTWRDQLKTATDISAQARESTEAREGLAAFREKRPPSWQSSQLPRSERN